MCKINEKLLTFYYSQDTEMPAVLLKGPQEVQFVKKFDVEGVAIEVDEAWWWSGRCWS